MSIAINIDQVTDVLLADGWHKVVNKSFGLDAYEYIEGDFSRPGQWTTLHGGGQCGICATGFYFRAVKGYEVAGPLTSIIAVKMKEGEPAEKVIDDE